jgi:hypothetical protein
LGCFSSELPQNRQDDDLVRVLKKNTPSKLALIGLRPVLLGPYTLGRTWAPVRFPQDFATTLVFALAAAWEVDLDKCDGVGCRDLLRAPKKMKGRFLLRELALSIPIFGDPVRLPDRNFGFPRITWNSRTYARSLLVFLRSLSPQ